MIGVVMKHINQILTMIAVTSLASTLMAMENNTQPKTETIDITQKTDFVPVIQQLTEVKVTNPVTNPSEEKKLVKIKSANNLYELTQDIVNPIVKTRK